MTSRQYLVIEIVVIVILTSFGIWEVKKVVDKQISDRRSGQMDRVEATKTEIPGKDKGERHKTLNLRRIVVHPEKRICSKCKRKTMTKIKNIFSCSNCDFRADWNKL